MSDYPTFDELGKKKEIKKDKIYFSNVFSKIENPEKNKEYIKLQSNLNSLSRDVRLLQDFVNRNNFGKKKLGLKKGFRYKNLIAQSNMAIRRKQNGRHSTILGILSKYISTEIDSKNKYKSKNKNKKNIKLTKKLSKSKENDSIYKTQLNKSGDAISKLLPKIIFNSDKSTDTNVEKNNNINVSDSSSILPSIINKAPKKLYLFTESNEDKEKNVHKSTKKFTKKLLLPKMKIDLDNNSFIKKFPNIIEQTPNQGQSTKRSINRYELTQSADKIVKIMTEKNQRIRNGIHYKEAEQELIDWEMKSRLKLARWNFGIAEIEKYFVDLRAYGKPEEEELLKRKTFYDLVEELIDEIKEQKEEKALKKITGNDNQSKKKKFFDEFGRKNKDKDENADIDLVDNAISKHAQTTKDLEKVKIRKLNEERKRHLITNILVQSDLSKRAIDNSIERLYAYKNKEEMDNKEDKDEDEKNKNEKKKEGDGQEKKEGTILKKEEEKQD